MDIDEQEEVGESSAALPPTTAGTPSTGGLLEGLDLQDLKNVTVPASAAQIGSTPIKLESAGAGTSPPLVAKGTGKNEKLVPLKGPDGQQVIGANGQPVMVPASMAAQVKGGRLPFIPGMTPDSKVKKGGMQKGGGKAGGSGGAAGTSKPGDAKPGEGRKRGGKKTRQVSIWYQHSARLLTEAAWVGLYDPRAYPQAQERGAISMAMGGRGRKRDLGRQESGKEQGQDATSSGLQGWYLSMVSSQEALHVHQTPYLARSECRRGKR